MATETKLVRRGGKRYRLVEESEYRRLVSLAEGDLPPLPKPDAEGNYPALKTLDALVARELVARRRELGLSQVELARRAGVRPETIHRIEAGKHAPTVKTVEKIDRALSKAEAKKAG